MARLTRLGTQIRFRIRIRVEPRKCQDHGSYDTKLFAQPNSNRPTCLFALSVLLSFGKFACG